MVRKLHPGAVPPSQISARDQRHSPFFHFHAHYHINDEPAGCEVCQFGAVYSVRRSLITDHWSFIRMHPTSGLLHAGGSPVVQCLDIGSPSSLVRGFLVLLYCISQSFLLLPTFPAFCLHCFTSQVISPPDPVHYRYLTCEG